MITIEILQCTLLLGVFIRCQWSMAEMRLRRYLRSRRDLATSRRRPR